MVLQFKDPANGSESVVKVALDGASSAVVLHTYTASDLAQGDISVVGVSGSKLIVNLEPFNDPDTGGRSTKLQTLSIDVPGAPTTIATFDDWAYAQLASGDLFVTPITSTTVGGLFNQTYATRILTTDGAELQPLTERSAFLFTNGKPVLQARNITDASNGYGGAEIYHLDISTPSSPKPVRLTRSDGGVFQLPVGATGFASAISATVGFGGVQGTSESIVYTYDLANGFIAPVSLPNTGLIIPTADLH